MDISHHMSGLGTAANEREPFVEKYGVTVEQICQAKLERYWEHLRELNINDSQLPEKLSVDESSREDVATKRANYLLRYGKEFIKIVCLGRLGIGKSALINTLFGQKVANESNSARPEFKVTCHTQNMYGITVTIVDTPGFSCVQKSSADILKDIKDKVTEGDLVLFCIKMTERFSDSEEELIKIIKSEMGVDILAHHTVFALTFANDFKVPRYSSSTASLISRDDQLAELFKKKLEEMKEEIYDAISRNTELAESQIMKIPVIPVGYDERKLPTIENWFVPFWYTCLKHINPLSIVALFIIGFTGSSLNQEDAVYLQSISESDPDNSDPNNRNFFQKLLEFLIKISLIFKKHKEKQKP